MWSAATSRGIPVTNCPDTFIEEVADHAMMLLLSSFRRTIEQDRMVREGKWREGRPALLKIPRPERADSRTGRFRSCRPRRGQTCEAVGLRVIAYDPYIEELVMIEHGVVPRRWKKCCHNLILFRCTHQRHLRPKEC